MPIPKDAAPVDLRIVIEPKLGDKIRKAAAAADRTLQQEVRYQLKRAYP